MKQKITKLEELKIKTSLVKQWKAKIKAKGLSVVKFSKSVGVNRITISNSITGRSIPTFATIHKVEEALSDDL